MLTKLNNPLVRHALTMVLTLAMTHVATAYPAVYTAMCAQ